MYMDLLLYYVLKIVIYGVEIVEMSEYNANSADPDQTPHVASDLGLHCLSMSL